MFSLPSFSSSLDDDGEEFKDDDDEEEEEEYALAYLLRYEAMVRRQDEEEEATMEHLRPLFDRIRFLGGEPEDVNDEDENADDWLSYETMKKALEVLDQKAKQEEEKKEHNQQPQDKQGEEEQQEDMEVMTTDSQLMMLLRTLVETYDKVEETTVNGNAFRVGRRLDRALAFSEFLHCYRAVILGVQALQMIGTPPSLPTLPAGDDDDVKNDEGANSEEDKARLALITAHENIALLRSRTKARTSDMIRTFGPKPLPSNQKVEQPVDKGKIEVQDRGVLIKDGTLIENDDKEKSWETPTAVIESEKLTSRRRRILFIMTAVLTTLMAVAFQTSDFTSEFQSWYCRPEIPSSPSSTYALLKKEQERASALSKADEERRKTVEKLQTSLSNSEKQVSTLQQREEGYKGQIAQLKEQSTNATSILKSTERELSNAQSIITTLQEQVENDNADTIKLAEEVEECRINLNVASADLERMKHLEQSQSVALNQCLVSNQQVKHVTRDSDDDEQVQTCTSDPSISRRAMIRRQILAAAGGVALALLAPHIWRFLGHSIEFIAPHVKKVSNRIFDRRSSAVSGGAAAAAAATKVGRGASLSTSGGGSGSGVFGLFNIRSLRKAFVAKLHKVWTWISNGCEFNSAIITSVYVILLDWLF